MKFYVFKLYCWGIFSKFSDGLIGTTYICTPDSPKLLLYHHILLCLQNLLLGWRQEGVGWGAEESLLPHHSDHLLPIPTLVTFKILENLIVFSPFRAIKWGVGGASQRLECWNIVKPNTWHFIVVHCFPKPHCSAYRKLRHFLQLAAGFRFIFLVLVWNVWNELPIFNVIFKPRLFIENNRLLRPQQFRRPMHLVVSRPRLPGCASLVKQHIVIANATTALQSVFLYGHFRVKDYITLISLQQFLNPATSHIRTTQLPLPAGCFLPRYLLK